MPGSEVWNVFPETKSSIVRLMTCQDYAGWIRDRMGGRQNYPHLPMVEIRSYTKLWLCGHPER